MTYVGDNSRNVSELLGKTITSISGKVGDEEIRFSADDGKNYQLYHRQDCCETVSVEDIVGDLQDLVGSPLVEAEEATSNENPAGIKVPDYQESFTWTFYKFRTAKGAVTIRWYGSSNGYYSESVQFGECE